MGQYCADYRIVFIVDSCRLKSVYSEKSLCLKVLTTIARVPSFEIMLHCCCAYRPFLLFVATVTPHKILCVKKKGGKCLIKKYPY